MDRIFVQDNARERDRMRALSESLTDEQLRLPIGTDWTIAVAFAHLAFWDQRSLAMLRKWKNNGVIELSPIDIDITNDSLLPLWLALEPRKAAELAVSSAEAIDRELENAPAELIAKIEALGEKSKLFRSIHRKLHLDEIDKRIQQK